MSGLERSVSQNLTMPLTELCSMHAGQVVKQPVKQ